MRTISFFSSRLLRCSISLLIVAAFTVASTNATPKRRSARKAKSVKTRIVKKTRTVAVATASVPVARPVTAFVATSPSQIPTATSPTEAHPQSPVRESASQIPTIMPPSESVTDSPKAAAKPEIVETIEPITAAYKPEAEAAPNTTKAKAEAASISKETEKALLADPIRADANWLAEWRNAPQPRIEMAWYSACYTDKDTVTCENFSKLLIQNCRESAYFFNASKLVIRYGTERQWGEFQKTLNDYYATGGNAAKLNRLFLTGEPLIHLPYVLAQMTLAGCSLAITDQYPDLDRVKLYVEKALRAFERAETIGRQMDQAQWTEFRRNVFASGNQFLGYRALEKDKNPEQASLYLTRAIAVKGDNHQGWKDPLNYYLRTSAFNELMARVNKKYSELSEEQRNSESGKALLAQMQSYRQLVADDYARIVVLVKDKRPEYKPYLDFAEPALRANMSLKPDPEAAYQEIIKRMQAEFAA